MANTVVSISFDLESLVPDVTEVQMSSGDSITFQNNSDIPATLFANKETGLILTPGIPPAGTGLEPGKGAEFGIGSIPDGLYSINDPDRGIADAP